MIIDQKWCFKLWLWCYYDVTSFENGNIILEITIKNQSKIISHYPRKYDIFLSFFREF